MKWEMEHALGTGQCCNGEGGTGGDSRMSTQLDGRGYSIRPFFLLSHLLPFPSLFSFFYQSDTQTLQSSKKALGKISV